MEHLDRRMTELFLDRQGVPIEHRTDYRVRAVPCNRRAGWPTRSMAWMLTRVGSALVTVGERLERAEPLQRRPDPTIG